MGPSEDVYLSKNLRSHIICELIPQIILSYTIKSQSWTNFIYFFHSDKTKEHINYCKKNLENLFWTVIYRLIILSESKYKLVRSWFVCAVRISTSSDKIRNKIYAYLKLSYTCSLPQISMSRHSTPIQLGNN